MRARPARREQAGRRRDRRQPGVPGLPSSAERVRALEEDFVTMTARGGGAKVADLPGGCASCRVARRHLDTARDGSCFPLVECRRDVASAAWSSGTYGAMVSP